MDAICSRVIPGKLRGKLLSRSGRSRESSDRSAISDNQGVVNRLVQRSFQIGNFHAGTHAKRSDLGSRKFFFTRNRDSARRLVVRDTDTTNVRQTNVCRV